MSYRGKGGHGRGFLIRIIVLVAAVLLGAFLYLSWVEYRASPKVFGRIDPGEPPADPYELSGNQSSTVDGLGYPDSFQIIFFGGESNGSPVEFRLETWTYYSLGRELSFLDGELVSEETAGNLNGTPIEIQYRPEQFDASMDLEGVISAAGIEEYIVVPMDMELVRGGEVFYAEELTFGMRDGELLYVETLTMYEEAVG